MTNPVWVVARGSLPGEKVDDVLRVLRRRVSSLCTRGVPPQIFDVPEKFDWEGWPHGLVGLVQELRRLDAEVEAARGRIEAPVLRLAPKGSQWAERFVKTRQRKMDWEGYVKGFVWDDAKFPRTKPVAELLDLIMVKCVRRLDEIMSAYLEKYNEFRSLGEQHKMDLEDVLKQEERVVSFGQAAWSDTLIAWIHLKAIRLRAEVQLAEPSMESFVAFILQPYEIAEVRPSSDEVSCESCIEAQCLRFLRKSPAARRERIHRKIWQALDVHARPQEDCPFINLEFSPTT